MAKITINIPDDKIDAIRESILYIRPNADTKVVQNPEYVNEEETPKVAMTIIQPKYTDQEWLKHLVIDRIVKLANDGARKIREDNAAEEEKDFANDIT